MAQPLRIYLSGSVRKGATDNRSPDHFWTPKDEEFIRSSVGAPVELLNPSKTDIRRQDFALNFGCDLYLVSISDVVLVDARREKGIGVGAEMMFAVQRGIPVITWAPQDTHYRRAIVPDLLGENLHDWTHPFVFGLSDHVVDDLAAATELIRQHASGSPIPRRAHVNLHIERFRRSIAPLGGAAVMRFVEIGGGVFRDLLGGGAEEEIIAGAKRQRFMDVLYLPTATDRIVPEAMLAVNRWRERRIAERPLLHSSRIRRIAAAVACSLGHKPRVLEIGCGKFPFVDDVLCRTWSGLEIDEEAVEHLLGRGLRAFTSPALAQEQDLEVDLAVALFCMQFAINEATVGLLGKLSPDAIVLFNVPTRDRALVERRIQEVRALGLQVHILDLHATDRRDTLVLAGRSEAIACLDAARDAALKQVRAEWPSGGPDLRWTEPTPSIAPRRKMRYCPGGVFGREG